MVSRLRLIDTKKRARKVSKLANNKNHYCLTLGYCRDSSFVASGHGLTTDSIDAFFHRAV